ncbi:DNA helicase-2/ATP-dependent DNA helicase PcrA [Tamilnaduibacter salinus]|uniref:DNA 3'-5' helicase n=1 Tax=Tamilnaduibacter salinus TaxID=1484056 RepID=A0A2U1CWC1_9GAMM|nr:ATP-dependent helicase [Tamilnaduibacter salinus]PVY76289.1 DNA helicase-2/ATP-dependent DNA helicase PcrA [Tamilnaduibacter salinus]
MTFPLPPHLTDEQRAIITADDEHTLITAVAGSGKTTTMAWRIHYLLHQGQAARRMLVLMFNRRAREDFQRKLTAIAPDTRLSPPDVRTYHSMGFRLYQRFVREGYLPDFNREVLSEQEIHFQVWQLTRQLVPEDLQDEVRRNKKEFVEMGAGFIDQVKTTIKPPEQIFEEQGHAAKHRYLVDLFHSFEQWRKRHSRISYADMLYEPVLAIHRNPPLQRLVGNKMDLVLVDEYQDTNEIQHLLLRYVAGDRARVTVVGDPDQTIYEFRGAEPAFILHRFTDEFDQPRQRTLSLTFRHGHQLTLAANHLITHNQGRHNVLSHAHPATPATRVHHHPTQQDSDALLPLIEGSRDALDRMAVLFRVWSQSVPIELQLLARQIPYQIDSGKGALFTHEVEAITQILRVCAGHLPALPPESREPVARRLLRFPHCGLKESELRDLSRSLAHFDRDWGQRLLNLDFESMTAMAARKLKRLGEALTALDGFSGPAHQLIARYADATDLFEGIRSLAMTHEAADERIDTVQGFQRYLRSLDVAAPEALSHLDQLRHQARQTNRGGVRLSTVHRTKGLEWPVVVIPGLQEKYLPHRVRDGNLTRDQIESERRLLYVAMTRAQDELHLIGPPASGPAHLDGDQAPSRFVAELSLPLSKDLGQQLDQAPEAGTTLQSQHPATPVSHRYLTREGLTFDADQAEGDDEAASSIWHHERVTHAILGGGTVTTEEDRSFQVRFDDGRILDFTKHNAHLYFRPDPSR